MNDGKSEADPGEMSVNDRLKQRLRKDRPMTTISFSVPMDVIEELKEIATKLGYSDYQPLIRAYIGRGLRNDAELPQIAEPNEMPTSMLKYTVVPDDPGQEACEISASCPSKAAEEWAEGRGHDVDDAPFVTVLLAGAVRGRFELRARVTWRARPED